MGEDLAGSGLRHWWYSFKKNGFSTTTL